MGYACRVRHRPERSSGFLKPGDIRNVNNRNVASDKFRHRSGCPPRVLACLTLGLLASAGCGVLGSGFLSQIDPSGTGSTTATAPPGFVVVTFANNAQVDEQLLTFLQGQGLVLTPAEILTLRPRVRLRVRITFSDGSFEIIEFISGSSELVDPVFASQSEPDLNQEELNNVVVVCDVASVMVEPGIPIEVFIPSGLTGVQLVQATGLGGEIVTNFEPVSFASPRFFTLLPDGPGADGLSIQRNVAIQDFPATVTNPICGGVIGISLEGTLSVPFHPAGNGSPAFNVDDPIETGTIGGRYEFRVSIG